MNQQQQQEWTRDLPLFNEEQDFEYDYEEGKEEALRQLLRGLSPASAMELEEQEAFDLVCVLRWPETKGKPVCPYCGDVERVAWAFDASRSKVGKLARCHSCLSRPMFSPKKFTLADSTTLGYRQFLALIIAATTAQSYSNQEIAALTKSNLEIVRKYRSQFAELTSLFGLGFRPPSEQMRQAAITGSRRKKTRIVPQIATAAQIRAQLAQILSNGMLYHRRSKVRAQLREALLPHVITDTDFNLQYGALSVLRKDALKNLALTQAETDAS